jgi:hypothetical protein
VQESATGNDTHPVVRQVHGTRNGDGEGGNSLGVAFGLGILQIECIAERLQRDVVRALEFGHGTFQLSHGSLQQLGAG